MKERDELTPIESELTVQPNSFNLEREGDIMDGTNGGPEQPPKEGLQEQRPAQAEPNNKEELERLLNNPTTPVGVRRAIMESLGNIGNSEPMEESSVSMENEDGREERLTQEEHDGLQNAEHQAREQGFDDENSKKTLEEAVRKIRGRGLENGTGLPESLEDLVEVVMRSASEEWKEGGDRALMNEKGEIVRENFIAWIRQRMVDLHEFNPTSKVNFFSDINVKVGYSQISFYEMIFTGSYFLQKKEEADGSVGYHKNEDYEAMKQQLILEAFLFSNSRNNDVEYYANMGSEDKLPELLAQIYYGNPFTRSNFLEKVLTMSSMDKGKIDKVKEKTGNEAKFEKEKIKTILTENTDIGEGVRRALLTYYYNSDFDMLEKILGKESVFFQEEYTEYDSATGKPKLSEKGEVKPRLKGKANQELLCKENITEDEEKNIVRYDKDGRLVKGSEAARDSFIRYVNLYNSPNKDERVVAEVRERVRQSIMESTGLSYSEAKYAEAWAYSMTRWTGIGARNDTRATGFDAWSKPQNLLEYRLKQLDPKRRGIAGNIFNLAGIKRASLTFFEGITDVHGRTVIEAIQGGQGEDWEEENPYKKEKVQENTHIEFNQDTSQRFVQNHVLNAFGIYKNIINHTDFNIEAMVTYDSFGRPIIDQEKANKMIDGIQKSMRYAYSTWAGTDYSKTVRVFENEKMRDMPIIAAMFGPDILKLIKKDIEKKGIQTSKPNIWTIGDEDKFDLDVSKVQSTRVREVLWKHILDYQIAKEIHSHRSLKSQLQRYDYSMTERIYKFLRAKGLITDEDQIKEMRKMSNSTQRVLFAEDFAIDFGKGSLIGFWKAMQIMIKDVASGK